MANSNNNDGVRIDNLRLTLPGGPRFAGLQQRGGEQLAQRIAAGIELAGTGPLALDSLRLRIHEHELGASPGEAIARAINRQLRGGAR